MKTALARTINLLLWLIFCALAGTGLLLVFRLPPGSRGGAGLAALGMTRHQWGDWHAWIAAAFLVLIAIHLALHWRWLWRVAAKARSWPLLAGLCGGVALFAWLALQPVSRRDSEHPVRGDHSQSGEPRDGRSR